MAARITAQRLNWREEWLTRAVISGFVATGVMTGMLWLAYFVAASLGSDTPDASFLQRWMWNLTHNAVIQRVETALPLAVLAHFIAGIAWAVVYGAVAEPRLEGPGWRRGLYFAPVPWVLSLLLFLPVMGGGFLGLSVGAGPLPIIGNLLLHLVYGLTLGHVYLVSHGRPLIERSAEVDPDEIRILSRADRTMALGIVVGLVAGGLIGLIGSLTLAPGGLPLTALMIGAVTGSGAGALLGSFVGLSPVPNH